MRDDIRRLIVGTPEKPAFSGCGDSAIARCLRQSFWLCSSRFFGRSDRMQIVHLLQILVVTAYFACPTPPPPELHVATPNIDLGVIRGGHKLTQCFELTNRGGEAIAILDVKRGCGCLATKIDQRNVPPGGKAVLIVELRTLGQADGPHTWGLEVQYRAGEETKTLALSVQGTVQSEITVQPAILGLHVTKQVQQEITLTDNRSTPLRVIAADARAPGLQLGSIERNGKTTKILVTADGTKLAAGRHEGVLTITTDDADYGQLTIPVVVTKATESAVRCVPEKVELRLSPGATTASAVVRLRAAGAEAVRIAKLEPSDASLTCTWASGPGNDATAKIQAQAAAFRGSSQAHVIVHFAAPAGEFVVIPVTLRRDD
jgi:Protein of unknown function (DUF1573)